jgi:uncharacterized radical SAM superfamily Fe-S cluster-containing enzyme
MEYTSDSNLHASRFRIEHIEPRKLPYITKSICPECLFFERKVNVILAKLSEESGTALRKKS